MTQQQSSTIDRAVGRAHEHGLAVLGVGEWTRGGARFFIVSSASGAAPHFVTVHPARLACDCAAGQHGKMCSHRGLVHEALQAERDAARRAETARLKAETDATLARVSDALDASERRETAMLASRMDNRAFSLFKA